MPKISDLDLLGDLSGATALVLDANGETKRAPLDAKLTASKADLDARRLSFRTLAALRAFSGRWRVDGVTASTAGYYAARDGGGATYTFSEASTEADDGGAVIRPDDIAASAAGRWLMIRTSPEINVRQFGARGDGSDDYARIMAALAQVPEGGSLYFPPPTTFYGVASPIVKPARGMTIRSDAEKSCSIVALAAMEAVLSVTSVSTGWTLTQITLDAAGLADCALWQRTDSHARIDFVTVQNGKVADWRLGSSTSDSGRVRGGTYTNVTARKLAGSFPLPSLLTNPHVDTYGDTELPPGWSIEPGAGVTATVVGKGGSRTSPWPTYKKIRLQGSGTVAIAFRAATAIAAAAGQRLTFGQYNTVGAVASGSITGVTFTFEEYDAGGTLLRSAPGLAALNTAGDAVLPPVSTSVGSTRTSGFDVVESATAAFARYKAVYTLAAGSDLELWVGLPAMYRSSDLPPYNIWAQNLTDGHFAEVIASGSVNIANVYEQTGGNNGYSNCHAWSGPEAERCSAFNFLHKGNVKLTIPFADGAVIAGICISGYDATMKGGFSILAPIGLLLQPSISRLNIDFNSQHAAATDQVVIGTWDAATWTVTRGGSLGSSCIVMAPLAQQRVSLLTFSQFWRADLAGRPDLQGWVEIRNPEAGKSFLVKWNGTAWVYMDGSPVTV